MGSPFGRPPAGAATVFFSWSQLQPAPEEWNFGWLDAVLDLLHANGISVDWEVRALRARPKYS
ncbi:MAG: beta-galactosidase [Actinomycetales bacterium]|nr:beta-galactosidase [Leifsonia sp.]